MKWLAGPGSKRRARTPASPACLEKFSKSACSIAMAMKRPCAAPSPASPSLRRMEHISRARRFMTAPVFVDTNVFLYALDPFDLKKQEAARMWREELWKSRLGRISFQVLREFY